MAENKRKKGEDSSTKSFDDIYGETIEKAIETGFLFGFSLNHYENHTRDELLQRGNSEDRIKCADRVLAHFDTSVGAKLGKLNPDLWSIHPCADCGGKADTRQVFSVSHEGFFCESCTHKRNSERKCSKCSSPVDDPAELREYDPEEDSPTVKKQFTGKTESGEYKYEYLCSWCALPLGYMDFLRNRGGTDRSFEDLDILIDQLRLVRKGDPPGFPTPEKLNKQREEVEYFDWYFDRQQGQAFGKKWEEYHISYTGILWAKFEEPPGPDFDPYPFNGLLVFDKEDPKKLYWICRIRIRHRESVAFLEIRHGHKQKPDIEIKNLKVDADLEKEIRKIWNGRKLFWKLSNAGRKEGGTKISLQDFEDLAFKAYKAFIEREEREPSDFEITEEIVGIVGIRISERTFYTYLKHTYGNLQNLRGAVLRE